MNPMRPAGTLGISVVIPCLNEAETIARAVTEARQGIDESGYPGEVVVADNGSTDDSRAIATSHGARVVPVPARGYGAALNAGILSARYACVIFGDADMSYPFREAKFLAKPILDGNADFVLGSRLGGTIAPGAMPTLNRYLGTPVLSTLIRWLYKMPTSDCNSGMRALARARYPELNLNCPGMEYASEMLVRASLSKWRYAEVPINFRKDQRSRAPHLRRWRDGWRHLRFILANAPSTYVLGIPGGLSALLFGVALAISAQPIWAPERAVQYHSAFLALALGTPLGMLALTLLLIKVALHQSAQTPSRLVHIVQDWSEKSYPIKLALFASIGVVIQTAFMTHAWFNSPDGTLAEFGAVIRLMALTFVSSASFALDMGIGLLRIIPYRYREGGKVDVAPEFERRQAS